MPLKTLLYIFLFVPAVAGSVVVHPIIGIYAYLATYNINPLGHWWGQSLPDIMARYSMILGIAVMLGVVVKRQKLWFENILEFQEILLLLFIAIMWLTVLFHEQTSVPYNVVKMTKVVLILLLASHIITTRKFFEGFIWVLIVSGLILAFELRSGAGSFVGGRFNAGVGGSDFGESNFLAAHFAILLPFIGVLLLQGEWKSRLTCLLAAVFILDSIVLLRSRGTFLGLAIGVCSALLFSGQIKRYRKIILLLIMAGLVGGYSLTNVSFWQRMGTIKVETPSDRDTSAQSRLDVWRGAWQMSLDNPLGIGVDVFFDRIGDYIPEHVGRDAHNTYLRCLTELGFIGLVILLLMIITAFRMLEEIKKRLTLLADADAEKYRLYVYAISIALIIYLVSVTFISSVYIEEFYWLLMMPVFVKRALDTELFLAAEEQMVSV